MGAQKRSYGRQPGWLTRKRLWPKVVGILFLLLWQGVAIGLQKPYILPSPVQVVEKIWVLREALFTVHLPATVGITFLGLMLALVLGLGLAVAMSESEPLEQALYPVVVASQTIPTTAIAPLFVLWFGYGIWSKVLVTVLITFFPLVINVHDGLKSVKREQIEYLISCGATPRQIFVKLKVPSAIPHFFAALKMAIPLSLIGAAIAEWLGGQSGLGYFSKRMITQLDGAGVFAPIVLLSLVAVIWVRLVGVVEHRWVTWRTEY